MKTSTETQELLKAIQNKFGYTLLEISQKLGMTEAMVSRWNNAKSNPTKKNLQKIKAIADSKLSPFQQLGRDALSGKFAGHPFSLDRDIVPIPVLGSIPAGPPADVNPDEIVEYLPMSKRSLNASPKNYYILRVTGDSMAPDINDGDEVLIRYCTDVVEGKVIAARVDGKFTLKKCCGHKGELLPINGKHEKVVAREDIQILGIAERVIKKL
jgi:SOS-response transcriptional repressor LexA